MKIKTEHIHRTIISRLFWVWLILTLLISTIVLFIEFEKVDKLVVKLALNESASILSGQEDKINSGKAAEYKLLAQKANLNFKQGHFKIVEIYDKHKNQILNISDPAFSALVKLVNEEEHSDYLETELNYRKFFYDKTIYLQIFVPLKFGEALPQGYFEGVYRVDNETMTAIFSTIAFSIGLVFISVLFTTVILYPVILYINKNIIQLTVDLSTANFGMLEVLGSAIAKRDSDTNLHNYRVTIYAVRLAEEIGLSKKQVRSLIKGAFLHDVGKIGISDLILHKPAELSKEEFQVMKDHVKHGVDIIRKYLWLNDAVDVVQYHHEKYDGSGYMKGLRQEAIPINARVFAIADVFDALTSKRPYKEAFSYERSVDILIKDRGTHFDPEILDAFLKISRALYNEICHADERVLENFLLTTTQKYF